MPTYKDNFRNSTGYLNTLNNLDTTLKNQWFSRNAKKLARARDLMSDANYERYAQELYDVQLWQGMTGSSTGSFSQDRELALPHIKNMRDERDFVLKYSPDYDENGKFVGSKKNTGLSPELWGIYNNLKDEESKKEFRNNVLTDEEVWKWAAEKDSEDKVHDMFANRQRGDVMANAMAYWWVNDDIKKNPNSKLNKEYLNAHKDDINSESFETVNNINIERAQNVWSRALKRYRDTQDYQSILDENSKTLSDRWNEDIAKNKSAAEKAHKEEFIEAIKENPVLSAAAGYDAKKGKFNQKEFDQYQSLMREDPKFKADYLAQRLTLRNQIQSVAEQQLQSGQITKAEFDRRARAGFINEDDYRKAIMDFAQENLKKHEDFWDRAGNAVKSVGTTATTYTMHKFAPFISAAEIWSKQSDGKVFTDADNNIYSDREITANAHYNNPKNSEEAILYRTNDGVTINYNKDGKKIVTVNDGQYIYQNRDGSFRAPTQEELNDVLSGRTQNSNIKKVNATKVSNTKVSNTDLIRLGKDDSGEDLNWLGGAFNEKYLQLADTYNSTPWNKEELDFFNQYGYSRYTNFQMPGDDSRDFLGENIKMMGFMVADVGMALITRGIGKGLGMARGIPFSKIGSAVGQGMRTMNALNIGSGIMGAIGIGDSYAQGVFEENLTRNNQALRDSLMNDVKGKAEAWLDSPDGQARFNEIYNAAIASQEQAMERPLTDLEKSQIQISVTDQILSAKTASLYAEEVNSSDHTKQRAKAIADAGTAAIIDFTGESLKYGLVNTLGFRKWMFQSGESAAVKAAKASEKTLFGKTFSRVATATAEDVQAGRASSVGEVFLKDAWSKMSKAQKGLKLLETTGKQMWGGAWTNWTDEMQSAGAKAYNNSIYDSHLSGDENGAYAFASALASHMRAMEESAFDPNSLWAGLIGGTGSIFGFGLNPMGILNLATKEGRERWNNSDKWDRVGTLFTNSLLNETLQQKANDKQADYLLERTNAMIKSIEGNEDSIIKMLQSASQLGTSESNVENGQTQVLHLLNTLYAINDFSKNNPGLAELDATENLRRFASEAEKLSDVDKLNEEERQHYIDEIKVNNPNMTEEEAYAELENVSKRAKLMVSTMKEWSDLVNSDEYKEVASDNREDKIVQRGLEEDLKYKLLSDYMYQNMQEREEKISGKTHIPTVDEETFDVTNTSTGEVTSVSEGKSGENVDLITYGNKKTALKNVKESYKFMNEELNQRLSNYKKMLENLKYEEFKAELENKISEAESQSEKESLIKELDALENDNNFYSYLVQATEGQIEENNYQLSSLTTQIENTEVPKGTVYTAKDIINLDPVSRLRMLNPANIDNYSKRQQKQIEKAISMLKDKDITLNDIVDQAMAVSRYNQIQEHRTRLANDGYMELSYNRRVSNMLEAADNIVKIQATKFAKAGLKALDSTTESAEEAVENKKAFLKQYSVSALRYMKDSLRKKDQQLIEELIPVMETASQLTDIIYASKDSYGMDLTNAERKSLQAVVAATLQASNTTEELIDNLSRVATDTVNPSLNTLLDKLGKIYSQQHSTIVETAKEKAERIAADRRAAQAREQAAQAAVAHAETAPSVSSAPTTEVPATETQAVETVHTEPTPTSSEVPATTTTEAKTDAAELIQEAKNTILATQVVVQAANERDPHADHYLINGEKYTRVHGAMGDVWVGPHSTTGEANKERSLKNGSIVDSIVRDFFNGETVIQPANFSNEAFASLMTSLETIKAKLIENGEEFLTNNIVLYHKFPNGVKIAGEADIVSIKIVNGKPQYNIYDLKTSAGGRNGKAFNESPFWETNPNAGARNTVIGTKEQYTNQVSLYKLLFERMLNTPVTNIALLPYKLTYDAENNVTGIEKYPGIELTYNPNVEKLVAYQPAIDEAVSRIQHTYKGMFTKEQLATLKGIIANGIIKGEAFGKDVAYFINNQELESQFKEIGMGELSPIIKDLKEAVSQIDVNEVLKETVTSTVIEKPVEPATPEELAPENPIDPNAYNPNKSEYTEPDVEAEFNTLGPDDGITHIPQTLETTEEEVDDINMEDNIISEQEEIKDDGPIAVTIKGNVLSPNEYESAKNGILVKKTPKTNGTLEKFNQWMESRKYDLQGLIDDRLSDILDTGTESNPVKIRFMRANPNMTAKGNDRVSNVYFLVVEDSPAIRRVYTQADIDRYGDFVSANGSNYLIIGTAGFNTESQRLACAKILTKGSNSVQVKSNNYFRNNADEEFYVDPDKYTHVASFKPGFFIKQLEGDENTTMRSLSELLVPERNPQDLRWDNMVFGYQMRTDYVTISGYGEDYRGPLYAEHNIGNVFLHIKAANGTYPAAMLTPTRYAELKDSDLKTEINNTLRQLASTNHAERHKALLSLFNLVVIGQKDAEGNNIGNNILIGTANNPSLAFFRDDIEIFKCNDLNEVNFQDVLNGFANLNPRIKVGRENLSNPRSIQRLDAAGVLRTDLAKLGKSCGDFSVYNIDADGKPIITDITYTGNVEETGRSTANRAWVDGQYFRQKGDKFIDENGNITNDADIIESIKLNLLILNSGLENGTVVTGDTEYFILSGTVPYKIIARKNDTHRANWVTDNAQIQSIIKTRDEQVAKSMEELRNLTAEIELNGENQVIVEAPKTTSTEEIDLKSSVQDLLNMDDKYSVESEADNNIPTSNNSMPASNINITERKSLLGNDNSGKNGNFAGETTAADILTSLDDNIADEAMDEINRLWPETEDMTIKDIVDFLRTKGKNTTSIKDVKAWIDTLKC